MLFVKEMEAENKQQQKIQREKYLYDYKTNYLLRWPFFAVWLLLLVLNLSMKAVDCMVNSPGFLDLNRCC